MVLDAVSNFVRGNTDAAVGTSDTTVSVADASIFPDPATDGEFNVVIWDVNNFPRPDQDGDVEILRVTERDTTDDELTVTRGQEMTSAAAHPEGSAIHLSPTAKMFSDIESTFGDFWDAGAQELTGDVNNTNTTTTSLEADQGVSAPAVGNFQKSIDDNGSVIIDLPDAPYVELIFPQAHVDGDSSNINDVELRLSNDGGATFADTHGYELREDGETINDSGPSVPLSQRASGNFVAEPSFLKLIITRRFGIDTDRSTHFEWRFNSFRRPSDKTFATGAGGVEGFSADSIELSPMASLKGHIATRPSGGIF